WLEKQKIEVVVPSIYNFFMCSLANTHVHKKFNVIKPKMPLYINDLIFKLVNGIVKKFDNICADFKYYRPFANMMHELDLASRIINPATNFGEGWMLPAEMAGFAENNINNIISLQPFGCIANQVISKGIEKRMKKLYPHTNFLFLDFDSGMSEANIFNRLHFIAEYSKK
ncbi:MAG: 2-hydroxyglutaryl-CoA dehydratase, partial [Candidatus Kapabacteria bacterium]|nr:2-hydroxyglutaryl-CoA dehydratase [Candidatus Kapabacteria bacterium]